MRRRHRMAFLFAVVLAVTPTVGCGDDDDGVPVGDATATTQRDRDRDRDRIHDAVADILDACGERDRDRLQDHATDQDRDRLRDGTCAAVPDGAEVSVVTEDIEADGDTATVTLRLQMRERDGATYERGDTWRFRWSNGGWLLSELPATIDSDAGTPSTFRAGSGA